MALLLNNTGTFPASLGPHSEYHDSVYVSPIDGVAVRLPRGLDRIDGILFEELKKAGELIRELRAEVEALKSKVG